MGVRDLDDRLLGQRGVLAVAVAVAVLALVGAIDAVTRSDVAAAVIGFLVALWCGYWAVRRWRLLRA